MAQPASIEDLKERYDDLNKQKTVAETRLESAEKELERLKKEALEKFGSDDLTALQEQLKEMKAENEQRRTTYEASLDKIESELSRIEESFQESPDEE